jgi:protein phosphatase
MTPVVRVCAVTGRGRVRSANEDALLVGGWVNQASEPELTTLEFAYTSDRPPVIAVADGLGGHPAGALASRLALADVAARASEWTDEAAVRQGLTEVGRTVLEVGSRDPATWGMATTIAGMVLDKDRARCFNVGDSRVYRVVAGYPEQVSVDHAVLGPDGTPSGRVTQALGDPPDQAGGAHVATVPVEPGDRFLVCSDGLTGPVPVAVLRQLLREPDLTCLVDRLLAATHQAGAPDNVSIIVIDPSRLTIRSG